MDINPVFATRRPAVAAWLAAKAATFDFAASLAAAVNRYGDLTPRQLEAVERIIAREGNVTAARAAAVGHVFTKIVELFANARKALLKKPVLRVGLLTLSLAGERSANAGMVYVKRADGGGDYGTGTYIGKIDLAAAFHPGRDAKPEDIGTLEATEKDPMGLAVAYGRRTGNCACCGRVLSDPKSVELGIGPICKGKWGL